MAEIKNKKLWCITQQRHFTDVKGVGSDPMYLRYANVKNLIDRVVDAQYVHFLAEPIYDNSYATISWYFPNWKETPKAFSNLSIEEKAVYEKVKEKTIEQYKNAIASLDAGERKILTDALVDCSEEFMYCYDGKISVIAWGMRPDPNFYSPMESICIKGNKPLINLTFDAGEHGGFGTDGNKRYILSKELDYIIAPYDLPNVNAEAGYRFSGWAPSPVGIPVTQETAFTAQYEIEVKEEKEEKAKQVEPEIPQTPKPEEPITYRIHFNAGEKGTLYGNEYVNKVRGSRLMPNEIPKVKAKKGFEFVGWDNAPLNILINEDRTFTAQYKKKESWWHRIWSSKFWKWLLWILCFLLLLLLLILLLRNCHSCSRGLFGGGGNDIPWVGEEPWIGDDPYVQEPGHGGIYDPGNPYTPVPTPPEYGDILPPEEGVLPIIDTNHFSREPGKPIVMDNVLNILMENEDKDIMELARDFKQKYPSDAYKIVYYDNVVKRMQIEVPVSEKNRLKTKIPKQFAPEYELYVFDESIYYGTYMPNDEDITSEDKTWYLNAVGAYSAWDISQGSDSVVVAIVDNGFNLNHPELKGRRIVMPYNVWTHSDKIFPQNIDHGTHVAGTALATMDNGKGLCGIAPKCRFMPVQVGNEQDVMTITAILDGVLYSLYQGANVINLSLGLALGGNFSESEQKELQDHYFKEEERLWNEIMKIANRHNAVLVIAAGNEHVLAGIDPLNRPSNFIVVSAVDKSNRAYHQTDFSNYGSFTTISAPGADIYSCYGNGYQFLDGTSMAAPIVTGAVALMKSIKRDITPEQIICVLQNTGRPISNKIGNLIQIDKALQKVKSGNLNDCRTEPVLSSGDVEITLRWNNYNDLDLHCNDPKGEHIFHKHRTSASGGLLEVDQNVDPVTRTPVEHIFWPKGKAPSGKYKVSVVLFKKHEMNTESTPFELTIKYGGRTKEYRGTVSLTKSSVCEFEL